MSEEGDEQSAEMFNEDTKPIYQAISHISTVLWNGEVNDDDGEMLLMALDKLVTLLARWKYIR